MSAFHRATKSAQKLRAAVFGPSGSGKTFSSLRIASAMADRIAVIDTERGSASKYADRFQFDTCELTDKTIRGYVETIKAAASAGYGVLIIDSLSHAWQELLAEVDRLAKAKYKGNTWSAWSEGTPAQRALVDAILDYPGHVLATMRSKTEWTTEATGGGKSRPVRVGLAPEQGKGIEYEFDLLLELSVDHVAHVIKDRTGKFQDQTIEKPGEKFGRALLEWLSEGEPVPPKETNQGPQPEAQPVTPTAAAPSSDKQTELVEKLRAEIRALPRPENQSDEDRYSVIDDIIREASAKVGGWGLDRLKKPADWPSEKQLAAALGMLRRIVKQLMEPFPTGTEAAAEADPMHSDVL